MTELTRTLEFTVDLEKPLFRQVQVGIMQEGDRAAHVIRVTLLSGGQPAQLGGASVSGFMQLADGRRVVLGGTVSGNVLESPLEDACYSCPGVYAAIIRLTIGHTVRTVLAISGYIEEEGTGAVVDPGHQIPTTAEYAAQMEAMTQALEASGTATGAANTAAGAANDAAGAANTAAGAANDAAGAANTAAGNANRAAAAWDGSDAAMLGGKPAEHYDPERIFAYHESESVTNLHPNINWTNFKLYRRGATAFLSVRFSVSEEMPDSDASAPLFKLPAGFYPPTDFLIRTHSEPYSGVEKNVYLRFLPDGVVTHVGTLSPTAGISLQFSYVTGGDV